MQLGSTPSAEGTHFSIYSSVADNVELCFFDTTGKPTAKQFLSNCDDDVWHDFVPGCRAGQRYGFRIHGPWAPERGLRCNPAKLMLDPYAKSVEGELTWNNAIFDYELHDDAHVAARCTQDNAPWVPFSVVCSNDDEPKHRRPHVPWKDTVFYECNVRGYTMQHPAVASADRGKFAGMRNADVRRTTRPGCHFPSYAVTMTNRSTGALMCRGRTRCSTNAMSAAIRCSTPP